MCLCACVRARWVRGQEQGLCETASLDREPGGKGGLYRTVWCGGDGDEKPNCCCEESDVSSFPKNPCIYGFIWPQQQPYLAWILRGFIQLYVCEKINSNAHRLSWISPCDPQLRTHHHFLILFYLRTEDLAFISTVSSFTHVRESETFRYKYGGLVFNKMLQGDEKKRKNSFREKKFQQKNHPVDVTAEHWWSF